MNFQTLPEAREKAQKLIQEDVWPGKNSKKQLEIPSLNTLYRWANREVISDCEIKKYNKDKGGITGYWSPLLHFEIVTAVWLKQGYTLDEIAEVASVFRDAIHDAKGVLAKENDWGLQNRPDQLEKLFREFYGEDFDTDELTDQLLHRPIFEERIIWDYLETFESFEAVWQNINLEEEMGDK